MNFNLDTVLNLPCTISKARSVEEIPLLSFAIKPRTNYSLALQQLKTEPLGYKDEISNRYFLKVFSGETLHMFLQRIYYGAGIYEMTSLLYIQLISIILGGMWPIHEDYIGFDTERSLIWKHKYPEVGCINVADIMAAQALSILSTPFKEQWVLQINTEELLGLTIDGPKIMSMEQWISYLYIHLKEYSEQEFELTDNMSVIDQAERSHVELCFELYGMNTWQFCLIPNVPSIIVTYPNMKVIHTEIPTFSIYELLDSSHSKALASKSDNDTKLDSEALYSKSDNGTETSLPTLDNICSNIPSVCQDYTIPERSAEWFNDWESLYPKVIHSMLLSEEHFVDWTSYNNEIVTNDVLNCLSRHIVTVKRSRDNMKESKRNKRCKFINKNSGR